MFSTILVIILFCVFIPFHRLLRLAFLAYSLHQFPWFYWRFRCLAVSLLSIYRTSFCLAAWFVYVDHVTACGWSTSAIVHSRDVVMMSQSWHLSQEANKSSGTCSVCLATRQCHIRDGTMHRYGPRSSPCPGSNLRPLETAA